MLSCPRGAKRHVSCKICRGRLRKKEQRPNEKPSQGTYGLTRCASGGCARAVLVWGGVSRGCTCHHHTGHLQKGG